MSKLLLTAFEPFDGETINPSLETALAIGKMKFPDTQLEILKLPVARFEAVEIALRNLREKKPEFVIMLGEAGGRYRVTPERVAINVDDYRIPDNSGFQPTGEPIVEDGPVGYFSSLPIYAITEQLTRMNIPSAISNSAGTYLCNRLFYGVMNFIARENLRTKAGFIHLPYLHEQTVNKRADTPSMSRETLVNAVKIAVETTTSLKN